MYPVSELYKSKIQENNRVFKTTIEIQHSKGVLFLTDKDLVQGTLTYTESTQAGENFTIGGTVASHIGFEILNKTEYDDIEFMGATVLVTIGLELMPGLRLTYEDLKKYLYEDLKSGIDSYNYTELSEYTYEDLLEYAYKHYTAGYIYGSIAGSYEYIPLGRFNIDDVNKQRNTIKLKAIDNMIELDKPYSLSKLSYPATLYQIYVNICNVCDVMIGTTSFPNMNYVVQERPQDDLTFRDMLGYVAELAGCFAKTNRNGALMLDWYKPSNLTITPHNRFNFIPRDDIIQIKGILATIDDKTYLAGSEDYAIDLSENPLLQGGYETVLPNIFNNVKDTVFTPYESNWQGNPAIQAGDIITQVDRDGKLYNTLVTSSTYKYRGASTLSAKGLPEISKGYKGSTNRKIAQVKRKIEKEVGDKLTTLEQMQLNATELIANMLGGYVVETEDALYIADDKNLSLAQRVWKWGLGGFGYSSTGVNGPYSTAITADGSIVAMLVAANIITANMVQTGILQSEDGSTWINLDDGTFNFKDIMKWVNNKFEVTGGDIYSANYQSGEKDSGTYIKIDTNGDFSAYKDGSRIIFMQASANEGRIRLGNVNGETTLSLDAVYDAHGKTNSAISARGSSQGLYLAGGSGTLYLPGSSNDNTIINTGNGMDINMRDNSELWIGSPSSNSRIWANTDCRINGDFRVTGDKNAIIQTKSYGERLMYSMEMPEVRFMDEGIDILKNGICKVNIDPVFLETIEPNTETTPWIIHLTPQDWINIKVKEIGKDYFIVEEKDNLDGKFNWLFSATRINYSNIRLMMMDEK